LAFHGEAPHGRRYRKLGEIAFVEEKSRQFHEALRNRGEDYLRQVGNRLVVTHGLDTPRQGRSFGLCRSEVSLAGFSKQVCDDVFQRRVFDRHVFDGVVAEGGR